jgi:hypothetical protein
MKERVDKRLTAHFLAPTNRILTPHFMMMRGLVLSPLRV